MTSSGLQTLLPGLGHSESKQKQRRGNRGEERREDQNNRERTEREGEIFSAYLFKLGPN